MKKKGALAAGLEIGALLLGVGLLGHYSCGHEGDVDIQREAKTFSVARTGARAPTTDGSAQPQVAIEDSLREILIGIATGQVTEEQRADVQKALSELLDRFRWGKAQNRMTAAALIVQQMFDQAKQQTIRPELDLRQRQAIPLMAKELTRQVMLTSTGASAGADAIQATIPAGHERITWNQLGGFPYQEGEPLPTDVSTLNGRSVGLPGFILTLGDTEDLHEFILVESLWGCCFGSVPGVNQTVLVRLSPGEAASYVAGPCLVTGVLHVGEEKEAGFVTSLYRIEEAALTPIDAAPPQR
jgi:hypothetical protein